MLCIVTCGFDLNGGPMLAQPLLYWWKFALYLDAAILSYIVAIAVVVSGVLLVAQVQAIKRLGR